MTRYIKSDTFFIHPDYNPDYNSPGDIGLIKMKSPVKHWESSDSSHHVVNIICLPVRTFRLKGTQMALIAGSGMGLDRVKIGPTLLTTVPGYHLNRENNELGSLTCLVSSLSPIYLVQ